MAKALLCTAPVPVGMLLACLLVGEERAKYALVFFNVAFIKDCSFETCAV